MAKKRYNSQDDVMRKRKAQTNIRREKKRGEKVVGKGAIKSAKAEARARLKYRKGYSGDHPGSHALRLLKAAWDKTNVEANKRIKRARVKKKK